MPTTLKRQQEWHNDSDHKDDSWGTRGMAMKTCPRDVPDVSWALLVYFLIFLSYFLITNTPRYKLKTTYNLNNKWQVEQWWVMNDGTQWKWTQMTPDALFGPYVCPLFFVCVFLYTNYCFLGSIYVMKVQGGLVGGDDEDGPKRQNGVSLSGPLVCFFFSFLFY